jgi:hypothetical protein
MVPKTVKGVFAVRGELGIQALVLTSKASTTKRTM